MIIMTITADIGADVRRQDIPGQCVIWSWAGSTPFVRHEIRLLLCHVRNSWGGVLASKGTVCHTITAGEDISDDRRNDERGEPAALDLIARMRFHEADKLAANRFLRSRGYLATEHCARPDCNCCECAGDPL
jgi:hypothetical protein